MSRVISSRKKFGIVFCLCYSVLTFISATADFDFRSAVLLLHTSKQSFHRKKLALTVTYFFVLIKICGLTDEVDLADNVVCFIAEHFIRVTFSRSPFNHEGIAICEIVDYVATGGAREVLPIDKN